ncbi:GlcG/HbpS family heme-binding protein [Paraburkholderia sp.]|uniref:GlcG/HbpS family heme-binding protein n=1 Tax=Paraburkholderia sp. TaxID=1926495 RepID=UPI0039E5BDA3
MSHSRTLRFVTAAVATVLAIAATSAHADDTNLVMTQKLRWQTAEALASEAVRVCASRGYSVTATVVDPSGHQQAVIKGDSVPLQSLSVSYRKAYTAYSYGLAFNKDSTSELIAAKVAGPLDGGVLATVPEVIFIPGGVTLRKADRTVIGGIGVSGAPGGDKDEACAQAAVDRYRQEFR